jgi:alpha-D-xyloside xylohydrolase
MRLLPYLYTAFGTYHLDGTPPFRAMLLEEGTEGSNVTDQYMFGPSILVAPYHGKASDERTVSLPPGNWYDFHTGHAVGGGREITVTDPRTPLFVKEGAVVPMLSETVSRTSEARGMPLELRVYGQRKEAQVTLYEDDGLSFGYLEGAYRLRTISIDARGNVSESIEGMGPALFGAVERVRIMPTE